MRSTVALAFALCLLLAPRAAGAQTPLDVSDPTPRAVGFALEISPEPATVGQTFGPTRPATWSASGNVGTLTISAATHEQLRIGNGWTAAGPFDPIVIEIDLTTLEATSQPASGAIQNGNLSLTFTQNVLDTTAVVSYIGPDVEPFICTSQEQVDEACLVLPEFCGQACIPVAGVAYDPATGLVNLVGSETQDPCDGGQCFGPYEMFATGGDLRLTETTQPPAVPSLPVGGALALALLLGAAARRVRAWRAG